MTICKGERVILGTLVWVGSLWAGEMEEGDPATADGVVSLPILGPGPIILGTAVKQLAPCAGGVHLGPAPPRPWRLLVEEGRQDRLL